MATKVKKKTIAPAADPAVQTSEMLSAIEHAWKSIRAQLPDVRPALITLGEGSARNVNGYYRCSAWASTSPNPSPAPALKSKVVTVADLVHIEARHLSSGGRGIFTTLLHESQHSLAEARDIRDTSRNGKYHNRRFADLAEQAGLIVQANKQIGHVTPDITDDTFRRYQSDIERLAAAIVAYLPASLRQSSVTPTRMLKLTCGCGRVIRASAKVIDGGLISCGVCGEAFTGEEE